MTMTTTTYAIRTVSGAGLPQQVDRAGYDTVIAAETMADEVHDGDFEIVDEQSGLVVASGIGQGRDA